MTRASLGTLGLIELLAERPRAMSLSEVAAEMDLSRSSCYRLLELLVQEGYLRSRGSPRRYEPTLRLWSLGTKILGQVTQERVYRHVRTALTSGAYPPSSDLPIGDLAEREGVGPAAAQAVLQRLESEGFVHFSPSAGFRVAEPDPRRLPEVLQVLGMLWGLSARLAATRITRTQLDELYEVQETLKKAAANNELATFFDYSEEFHQLVIEASGSEYLGEVNSKVQGDAHTPALRDDPTRSRLLELFNMQHELLLDAFEKRDAVRAEQLMIWHVQDATTSIRFPDRVGDGASAADRSAAYEQERPPVAPAIGHVADESVSSEV